MRIWDHVFSKVSKKPVLDISHCTYGLINSLIKGLEALNEYITVVSEKERGEGEKVRRFLEGRRRTEEGGREGRGE